MIADKTEVGGFMGGKTSEGSGKFGKGTSTTSPTGEKIEGRIKAGGGCGRKKKYYSQEKLHDPAQLARGDCVGTIFAPPIPFPARLLKFVGK